MELWIRNQDRDALIKIDNIYAYEEDDIVNLQSDFGINKSCILGRYKTKERALEVLDEIQEHIENRGQSFAESNGYGVVTNYKYYGNVYIMPKE